MALAYRSPWRPVCNLSQKSKSRAATSAIANWVADSQPVSQENCQSHWMAFDICRHMSPFRIPNHVQPKCLTPPTEASVNGVLLTYLLCCAWSVAFFSRKAWESDRVGNKLGIVRHVELHDVTRVAATSRKAASQLATDIMCTWQSRAQTLVPLRMVYLSLFVYYRIQSVVCFYWGTRTNLFLY